MSLVIVIFMLKGRCSPKVRKQFMFKSEKKIISKKYFHRLSRTPLQQDLRKFNAS